MAAVKPESTPPRQTLRAERAEVTRRRIVAAARVLFARDGYGATTLHGIATEAGVAVQTVYAVYGSKAGTLAALLDSAVQQPQAESAFRDALAQRSAKRRLDLFARSIRLRWELAGDVVAIHRDASTADPSLRPAVQAVGRTRRNGITALARSLEIRLRPGIDVARAAAILDALTLPEVYAELVEVQGWTPDQFEAWLAESLRRQLLRG
ncbi:MAG: TetR/AcrR family transcriptional regulator [Candidatus Limnocylindrales bacterium]|nr:TetR/AcrR family transcriptional regulator [Candidatus Limnocylindrales bacterium]